MIRAPPKKRDVLAMKTLAQVLLWVSGLGYAGFGVAFLLAPLRTMALAGITLEGGVAAVELRAFYGGLELALGALIVAAALAPGRLRDGLRVRRDGVRLAGAGSGDQIGHGLTPLDAA